MSIVAEINKLENKLDKLKARKEQIINILKNISVGNSLYEEGVYLDFFQLEVLKIDFENCLIYVKDKSITNKVVEKWCNPEFLFIKNNDDYIVKLIN